MKKDNRAKGSSNYSNNKKEIIEKKVDDSEVNKNENVEENLKKIKEEADVVIEHHGFSTDFEKRKRKLNEDPDNSLKNATVICTCLNVREKPMTTSRIIGVIRKDEKVIVKNINNGWASIITTTGLNGYCMCEFIQV